MEHVQIDVGNTLKTNFIEAYKKCYNEDGTEKLVQNLDKVRLIKAAQELGYKSGLFGRDINFGIVAINHVNEQQVKRLYRMVTGNV